jgi:hypothetical protein
LKDSVLEKLRYPIGKFKTPEIYTTEYINAAIAEIATFPEILKKGGYSFNRATTKHTLSTRRMDH